MYRSLLLFVFCLGVSACGAATPPPSTAAPQEATPVEVPAAPTVAATATDVVATVTATTAPAVNPTVASTATSASLGVVPERLLLLQDPPLSGDDVQAVQDRLLGLGYAELGAADGIFGPRTDAAVRRFQSFNSLTVDGVVGPQTVAALRDPAALRGDPPAGDESFAVVADTMIGNAVLGAGGPGGWLPPDQLTPAQFAGPYTLYTLEGPLGAPLSGVLGATPDPQGGPCFDLYTLDLQPVAAQAIEGEARPIAVKAPWNPLPRRPELLDPTNPTYVELVAERLREQGITAPDVRIESIVRVDLEGDGEDEVLISATRHEPEPESIGIFAAAGDYSFVLLRRVVDGNVVTIPLIEEYFVASSDTMITTSNSLLALLDLNGDGRLEVVAASDYYEGANTLVFEIDAAEATQVLVVGCGV